MLAGKIITFCLHLWTTTMSNPQTYGRPSSLHKRGARPSILYNIRNSFVPSDCIRLRLPLADLSTTLSSSTTFQDAFLSHLCLHLCLHRCIRKSVYGKLLDFIASSPPTTIPISMSVSFSLVWYLDPPPESISQYLL